MSDTENQMGLFEVAPAPVPSPAPPTRPEPPAPEARKQSSAPPAPPARRTASKPAPARRDAPPGHRTSSPSKAVQKGVSGLVPEGDVRLTANIRQDLHLKLKIASAYRRTTIGEIIEELIEKYV